MTSSILTALLLSGLMGLLGQGARAAIGLKKAMEEAKDKGLGQTDVFSAARLLVSLMIGFIAGVLAGIVIGIDKIMEVQPTDMKLLLGIAAAGYAGVDFIEGAFSKLVATPADAAPPQPTAGAAAPSALALARVEAKVDQLAAAPSQGAPASFSSEEQDAIRPALATATATPSDGDVTGNVTVAMVSKMFPATPKANISKHLPNVLSALRSAALGDKSMVLMALATIRAETEGFVPISEFKSKFNTAVTPFDKYEPGTPAGTRLGNTQTGDGPRFRGRGFVQLTGRDNYTRIGNQLGHNLVANPDLANDPVIASSILAQFLANHEEPIREALAADDLREARRLVNGGTHGFVRFESAYRIGENVIPA